MHNSKGSESDGKKVGEGTAALFQHIQTTSEKKPPRMHDSNS